MPILRPLAPALIVGVLGFTLTLDLRLQSAGAPERAERRETLARIIAQRETRGAQLEGTLEELRSDLDAALERAGGATLQRLRAQAERLRALAGLAPMDGPGIVVTLSDAPDATTALHDADTRIQDVDIRSVVNELWAGGAEAIAVDGQRLIASSAIRNAGGAVLVNFRVLSSPYRIVALGDPPVLRDRLAASPIAKHLRRWVDVYRLGYGVEVSEHLRVPAFTGAISMREARAAGRG